MKHLTRIAAFLFVVYLGVILVSPLAAAASTRTAADANTLTAPITGTLSNGDTFTGTMTITRFLTRNNLLLAAGTVSGTLNNVSGGVITTVTNVPAALPVTAVTATCSILNLTLGPLDLNLLGLHVHLNQVILHITAIPGPGNLLGNLLCAIAGLLNGGAPLTSLVNLLNQVLAAL